MKVLSISDLKNPKARKDVIKQIKTGKIFVYPTDTVYGIGCNALQQKSVKKIRAVKKSRKPFSVIAPSKAWIERNLLSDKNYLKKLPGPYTLIFEKRDSNFLKSVSPTKKLGVRIPAHPFTKLVQEANVPFVTTSANFSGQPVAKDIHSMPYKIFREADFVIDSGRLGNKASKVIDLSGKRSKVLRR